MASEIDTILSRALAQLGNTGAGWMSRLLPRNVGEESCEVRVAPDVAATAVTQLLADIGQPLALTSEGAHEGISALVGSGALRLNPAVVTVWLSPASGGPGTHVRVRAIAKEGLVKQRGGEQVAREIVEQLRRLQDDAPPAAS